MIFRIKILKPNKDKKETRDVTDWKPFCPRVFGTQFVYSELIK